MTDKTPTTKTETVKAVSPVVQTGEDPSETNAALTKAEQEALVDDDDEERSGTMYYILLDEFGQPTGKVQTDIPDDGTPYAPAMGVASLRPEVLSTPSGAPITKNMNPAHSFIDPALLARNPPPNKINVGDKIVKKGAKETVKAA